MYTGLFCITIMNFNSVYDFSDRENLYLVNIFQIQISTYLQLQLLDKSIEAH